MVLLLIVIFLLCCGAKAFHVLINIGMAFIGFFVILIMLVFFAGIMLSVTNGGWN